MPKFSAIERVRNLGSQSLIGTLVLLALAATCAAAPGTPVVSGVTATSPGGFIFAAECNQVNGVCVPDGIIQTWVTDAAKGFCRITVDALGASQLTACVQPSTATRFGQPAFDGAFLYLPDYGAGSTGIWRYNFDGVVFSSGVNFSKLAIPKPNAIALGPDGSLYVTVNSASGGLFRVNNPISTSVPPVPTSVKLMTKVPSPNGLAFVGSSCLPGAPPGACDLWIAEAGSLAVISGAIWQNCATGTNPACVTTPIQTQPAIVSPTSIAFDTANNYAYVGVPAGAGVGSGVWRINPVTQATDFYTAQWVKNGTPGQYYGVTALGVDNVSVPTSVGQSNLYLVDDPSLGAGTAPVATVYQVPLGGTSDAVAPQQPPFPTDPTVFLSATANPAWPYFSGLTHAMSALWMGNHMWVMDSTHGFCRVDATPPPPATPSLTNCVLTTSPGLPAFDAVNNLLYTIPSTTAIGSAACIQVSVFDPVAETLGGATTVSNCGPLITAANAYTPLTPKAKAPTALAFGPDGQLYMAMGATTKILKFTAPTNPASGAHVLTVIGNVNSTVVKSLAFYKGDLYDIESGIVNNMPAATLCQVNCLAWALPAPAALPASLASDGTFLYVGDGAQVWKFDSGANTFTKLANTGPGTRFGSISGLAIDPQGQVYAADQGPVWQISAGIPTNLSLAPNQAAADTTPTVTITGSNFVPGTTVTACPLITVGVVNVVSATQINVPLAIGAALGVCPISVTTNGTSVNADFTVTVSAPPVITSIVPPSGDRGGASLPNTITGVIITGTTLLGATLSAGPDIDTVITSNDGTTIIANFAIHAGATLGPVSVILVTPSGDNTLTPPAFNITAPLPTFTSITPTLGPADSTYLVTINGTGFLGSTLTLPSGVTLFNGIQPVATQTSISATLVFLPAPVGAITNNQVVFTANTPGGPINANFTIVPQGLLGISSTHGTFTQAGTGTYTLAVSNAITSSATNGTVTVTETLPPGLNLQLMSGTGWLCVTNTCTRADALAGGGTYPLITAAVNVHAASTPLVSNASASLVNSPTASTNDSTVIAFPPPTLTGMTLAVGVVGTSVPVTFTGTNFTDAILTLPTGITTTGWVVDPTTAAQISVTLDINPIAPLGPQIITISTPLGGAVTTTFMVLPLAPQLTSITPAQGVTGISEPVIVTGTNLSLANLLVFDASGQPATGITASVGPQTTSQIAATLVIAPTAAAGTYTIKVTTPFYSNVSAATFTVVLPPAAAAALVKTDTTTQGTWKTVYGADGQAIANDVNNYPLYAQVAITGQLANTWTTTTTDVRAPQRIVATGRIASTWYSNTSFSIDINLTDGLPHQVALYCLDWDGANTRADRIDVLDAATGLCWPAAR